MATTKKPKVDMSKETDIYTVARMGEQPPMDPEVAPPTPKASAPKPVVKKAKGGNVAKYARGGGIEQRGKTRGKMC